MTVEASSERLHALDAVRAGALLLGVAFHATLSFLPGPQIWVVRDAASQGLSDFFYVAHIFRMTAFFVIAGYFGRMLLHRRGTGGFAANRAKRIALPLLVFWPLMFAGIIATFIWGAATMNGGTLPTDGPPPPPITLATFPLTHLWFLYVLLIFYAATIAIRALVTVIDSRGSLRGGIVDPAMRLLVASPLAPALLAAPLAVALALHPVWFATGGIPTPDTGIVPNTPALVGFGTAYGFGWLLQRNRSLLDAIQRWWPVNLLVALILTAASWYQVAGTPMFVPIAEGTTKAIYAISYSVAVWAWTLAIIGAAMRFLSNERPAVRYVADASYWIYLVHLPIVMALQVMVYSLALPALAKWTIVVGAAFLILFASYHLLVRHSWLGSWLNGRKLPWRAAAKMEMQTA